MARTRTGSIRERPDVYFATVSFVDEQGETQKIERQAETQKQAQSIIKEILRELSTRKNISIKKQSVREKRGGIFARVTYVDDQGQRREVERRAKNRTDAKVIIKELLRDLDDHGGSLLDAARMTFTQLADYYQQNYLIEPEYVDGRKVAGYRGRYIMQLNLKVLRDYFTTKRVKEINHGDIKKFKAVRLKTPAVFGKNTRGNTKTGHEVKRQRSIATVHKELGLLRRVLNVAVSNGWLIKNPFEMGDPLINPGDEKHRERILTRDEEEKLLAACTGARAHLRPVVIMALDTGMRRGEIFKLKWSDVDLENGVINIQAFNTKTMRERQIAITSRLAQELRAVWESSPMNLDGLVFGMSNAKKAFGKARTLAGLPDLRFHDLRHTHATRLVGSHLPLSEVGRMLGHTQANTTFRYVNVNLETARRAAAMLDKFNESVDEGSKPLIN